MKSLDKLQQTLALLNAVRGASLGIQTTINKVTSIVRSAFDTANNGAIHLSLSLDALVDSLQAGLRITPTLLIDPKIKLTPRLTINPTLHVNPELNIAPKLNIKPELNITPKLNIKPELNITPKLNINPAVNITPTLNIKPTVNFKPTLNFKPIFNVAPTLNLSPKIKLAPRVSLVGSIFGALKASIMGFVTLVKVAALGAFNVLRASIMSVLPAVFAFTLALLANPITWIVVGIVALIAAIVGLIVYWDQVTAAVGNFFSSLGEFANVAIFEPIKTWWNDFSGWLAGLNPFAAISAGWEWIKGLFAENTWLQTAFFPLYAVIGIVDALLAVFDKIPEWWANFKEWLSSINPFSVISDGIKSFAGKFGFSFGSDKEESNQAIEKSVLEQQNMSSMVALPGADTMASRSDGGLIQSISNEFGGQKKSTQVDKIEVHNHSTGVRGADIAYELEMVAG